MRSVQEELAWEEQPNRCALVAENASIHDEVSFEVLRDAGVIFLFLPPYSPDFSSIEDVLLCWEQLSASVFLTGAV